MPQVQSSRLYSGSRAWCAHNKLKFQEKFKARGAASSAIGSHDTNEDKNETMKVRPPTAAPLAHRERAKSLKIGNLSERYSSYNRGQESLDQTCSRLKTENFRHHNPDVCVCSECDCGRHFCQFHTIKPDLSKKSVYKKDYHKQKTIKNKVNISSEYDRFTGPNLSKNSTYIKDYNDRLGDQVQKPKPEDQLSMSGAPIQKLTSYGVCFPGHHGSNQYVKPTDKYTRGQFPLRSKSTYSRSFICSESKKTERHKIPDNLKTKTTWFGTTTYSNFFQRPNPEHYSDRKHSKTETYEASLNDKNQFETVYNKSFVKQGIKVCPAKIALQSQAKGQYSGAKDRFSENTDFKALSPNFQAISTSKNFYV